MARFLVKRELAARQNIDRFGWIKAALGIGIEGLNAINVIVDQINPQGKWVTHRK